eukprot:894245-Rhodomonas_salina.4
MPVPDMQGLSPYAMPVPDTASHLISERGVVKGQSSVAAYASTGRSKVIGYVSTGHAIAGPWYGRSVQTSHRPRVAT